MNKTVVIHQPDFLSHIGFFHRFLHADLWVIFDNVQFLRSGWHNRDKIKTPNGAAWLTVSVQRCPRQTPINEIMLSKDTDWRMTHMNLIRTYYRGAGYFDELFPYIEELYGFECEKMIDFNMRSIEMLLKVLDIRIPSVPASALDPKGKKNELLVDILKKVDASTYLTGTGSRDYLDEKVFEDAGIKVTWQDMKYPVYPQLYGDFMPFLSSIDMLFNCGIERSREIIRGC